MNAARLHLAEQAYQLAARIRSASHDAYGHVVIGPADALPIARMLDKVAAPLERREGDRNHGGRQCG